MRLLHHGAYPGFVPWSRRQGTPYFKPNGLWVSDDHDYSWAEWCTDNAFDGVGLYTYRVELDMSAILHLSTVEGLREFTDEYRTLDITGDPLLDEHLSNFHLNWDRVAEKYAGILITPYLWGARMRHELFWYYTWDCASGCVWDVSAISSFRPYLAIEAAK